MILLIDNYDSFTYNVYQMIGEIDPDIQVFRNDALTLEDIRRLRPERIILSPGPGYPVNAGLMPAIIHEFHQNIPMLGICLGHQALAESFGARIIEAPVPVHGKGSPVQLDTNCPIFSGLAPEQTVGRYHSLIVDAQSLPSCCKITATSPDGLIMAVQHRELPVFGLQFHPESILTNNGKFMIEAFIKRTLKRTTNNEPVSNTACRVVLN